MADALAEVADQLDSVLRPLLGNGFCSSGPEQRGGEVKAVTPVKRFQGEKRVRDVDLDRVLGLAPLEWTLSSPHCGRPPTTRTAAAAGRGSLSWRAICSRTSPSSRARAPSTWPGSRRAGPGAAADALRLAPVEIGARLAARLWPDVTAVLTSATVPPLLEVTLGLPEAETDRIDVGSPFPYERCALLYCPTNLPDRRSPDADSALQDELYALIVAAGGRTLALFTSWRAMQAAVEALRPRLDFTVLAQNDLPKPKLLEAFSKEDAACLFATMSFWQGVDVPGRP